jgi:hypothetical protein
MLGRLATRLLFILCFAVVIRVGGGLISPHRAKPGPQMVAVTDRFGSTHMVPGSLEPDEDLRRLDASIEDQYARVKEEERPEHVSFEPGQPMIDPSPRR